MRLGQAMLFVRDIEAMAAFYRDAIGLEPIAETHREDWIEFDAGEASFALHSIPRDVAQVIEKNVKTAVRETQSCKLLFTVDDLDAERARLAAAGVTILDRPWGGWDVVDPEGNVRGVRAS